MNKKIISAMLFGAMLIAPGCTFVSCSDYDAEIAELRDQISVQASSLKELSDEKLANVTAEIELLKAEAEDIREAYEAADNATQQATLAAAQALVEAAQAELEAALKAAEERIAANEGSIAALIEADATLQTAIDAAQARADKAYELAVSAAAQAEKNADDIKKISEDLDAIRTTLAAQISVLGDEVKALSATIGEQQAAIEAQQAAIEALQKDQAEIAKVNETIAQLQSEIAANKAVLEKMITDEVAAVSAQITTINASIETLTAGYQAADAALQAEIDGLKTALETTNTNLNNLSAEIAKVNGLVDVLFTDLGRLITGVIIQDVSQIENVYAKVTNWTTHPADRPSSDYFDAAGVGNKVYFPYKGAENGITLSKNQYNYESDGGYLYVTVNPSTINFAGQKLYLVDSKNQEADKDAFYSIGLAEVSKEHLIQRATGDDNGYGLYKFAVTNKFGANVAPAAVDASKNLYAVAAAYKAKVKNEKGETVEVDRYVTSKYELQLKPVLATALTSADFELKVSSATDADEIDTSVDKAFKVLDLSTKFELTPCYDSKKRADKKVYKKYIQCVKAVSSLNTSTNVTGAVEYMNDKPGFQTALSESDANFNGFDVSDVAAAYNGYIFTFDYYIWNYDGSIYKKTYEVTFTKPLYEEEPIAMTHIPESSNPVEIIGKTNSEFSKSKSMTTKNAEWKANVAFAKVTAARNSKGKIAPIDKVLFYNATGVSTSCDITVNSNGSSDFVSVSGKTANIKNMTFIYNPSKFSLYDEYVFNLEFYNAQKNIVTTIPVKFTMNKPIIYDAKVDIIPAAFVDDSKELIIAWAKYDPAQPNAASWSWSNAFNYVGEDFGMGSYVRFDDPTAYNVANQNTQYKPITTFPTAIGTNMMIVPSVAVDGEKRGGSDYVYELEAAVQYFGLSNLWDATYGKKFKIKWQSRIAHATWQVNPLTVEYPGSVTLTQSKIDSKDVSKSTKPQINYFGGRDSQIANIQIVAETPGADTGLFQTFEVRSDGIYFETTNDESLSSIKETTVRFKVIVTDVFGVTVERPIEVTVNPNSTGANKK